MSEPAVTRYGVGPFQFDDEKGTITLQPGVYTLAHPVVFGRLPETKITGGSYTPSADRERAAADDIATLGARLHEANLMLNAANEREADRERAAFFWAFAAGYQRDYESATEAYTAWLATQQKEPR